MGKAPLVLLLMSQVSLSSQLLIVDVGGGRLPFTSVPQRPFLSKFRAPFNRNLSYLWWSVQRTSVRREVISCVEKL